MKHVAIFDDETIKKIFSGEKTVDLRLSQKRIAPYGKIVTGDKILIKKSGGEIVGQCKALRVVTFDNLSVEQLEKLKKEYGKETAMDDAFWQAREHIKYATLIFIVHIQPSLMPLKFKKRDRRAWVVLK